MASAKNREGEHVISEGLDAEKTEKKHLSEQRSQKKKKVRQRRSQRLDVHRVSGHEKKENTSASVKLQLIIF